MVQRRVNNSDACVCWEKGGANTGAGVKGGPGGSHPGTTASCAFGREREGW